MRITVTVKQGLPPLCPWHPGHLNDSRCISSVPGRSLLANHPATARTLPPRRYIISLVERDLQPTIAILPEEASFCLLIRQQLFRVLAVTGIHMRIYS
ncbi:hypothetical protein AVEN_218037-1 [Araneus ventricosus]|uniref:Uncharacterized protein n=1 Tax=Araneus ventricosus TaxID=182803 RepID=A0A4Y2LYH9_ARAVE|nr:hypothetical protein AVEN_218037-1 [Araneus ventricosus]